MLGYDSDQNSYEGYQLQVANTITMSLFALKNIDPSVLAFHDPSERSTGLGRLWMPQPQGTRALSMHIITYALTSCSIQNTNEVDVLQGMNWKVSSGNLKVLSGMRHD
jgi:hypothetical protein